MPSYGMWSRVDLVRTDVSEECLHTAQHPRRRYSLVTTVKTSTPIFIFIDLGHWMDESGQFHVPAILSPEKELPSVH
jgi:hypothetical protein